MEALQHREHLRGSMLVHVGQNDKLLHPGQPTPEADGHHWGDHQLWYFDASSTRDVAAGSARRAAISAGE
jgi:hypothetical protein